MRPATKSLREVAYAKPLRECGIEELAIHQWTANPSGGVMFARRKEHDEKDHARSEICRMFGPEHFPKGLAILTMPGMDWRFEKSILRLREGNWEKRKGPHRTHLTCIESDRSIYHAAVTRMPGLNHPHSVTVMLPGTAFAERAVRNKFVGRFFFGNVDDLMQYQEHPFDAAWLDYTGPLTVKRMRIIADFYAKNIRHILVVTALKARWNVETSEAIAAAGGHSQWLRAALPGEVMHDIEYQDGSPMAQFAVRTQRSLQKRCFC